MKRYDFTLVLSKGTELTDQLVEDLYEAGCDDGSPGSRGGTVMVTLHREAESLEQAIRSGIADVQKASCSVAGIVIKPGDFGESLPPDERRPGEASVPRPRAGGRSYRSSAPVAMAFTHARMSALTSSHATLFNILGMGSASASSK